MYENQDENGKEKIKINKLFLKNGVLTSKTLPHNMLKALSSDEKTTLSSVDPSNPIKLGIHSALITAVITYIMSICFDYVHCCHLRYATQRICARLCIEHKILLQLLFQFKSKKNFF